MKFTKGQTGERITTHEFIKKDPESWGKIKMAINEGINDTRRVFPNAKVTMQQYDYCWIIYIDGVASMEVTVEDISKNIN